MHLMTYIIQRYSAMNGHDLRPRCHISAIVVSTSEKREEDRNLLYINELKLLHSTTGEGGLNQNSAEVRRRRGSRMSTHCISSISQGNCIRSLLLCPDQLIHVYYKRTKRIQPSDALQLQCPTALMLVNSMPGIALNLQISGRDLAQ
jgi:hypothetical protein